MPLTWTRIEEGDSLDNSSLNTKFQDVRTEINALEVSSVAPRALHQEHLPSAVVDSKTVMMGTNTHTYKNIYPGAPTAGTLTTGTTWTPGWALISEGGTDLKATLATGVDLTDSKVAGCLIMANIQMSTMADVGGGAHAKNTYLAFFHIQVEIDGTWRSIEESERYSNSEVRRPIAAPTAHQVNTYKDIPLRAYLTATTLGTGAGLVTGARVVVSCAAPGGTSIPIPQPEVTLQHSNLSIIGLYGTATEI